MWFSADWIGLHLGRAERRRVAILASGNTAPADGADSTDLEEMARLIHRYRHEARLSIESFGGHIVGQSGTSLMACWGFPSAGEDHLRRALHAALQIAALGGPDLQVGCGVDTGLVVADRSQGEARGVNLTGPALRKAERLQAAAEPGTVVVSDAVQLLVGRSFELRPLASSATSGIWRVINPRRAWRRAPAVACGVVGHVTERQSLDEIWLQVVDGHPQCVSILGEAGIGKSRLLRYLEQKVASAGGTWIEIGCLPETSRAPLQALRQAMDALPEVPAAGLAKYLAALGEPDRNLLQLFLRRAGALAGCRLEAEGSRQDRLFALIRDWIAAQASIGPIALVFEDLHWADPATIDFVTDIGERLASMGPICLASTSRGPEPLKIRTAAQHTELRPGRLTTNEIQQLLACSPSGSTLTTAAREQIAIRSEGIPLFAEELARLCANAQGDEDGIDLLLEPGPLNVVLSARLDALGELKTLAQAAAVIGRQFDVPLIALALQMDRKQLTDSLQKLVTSGFLETMPGRRSADVFRFSHALLRDAAYASVLKARRRELHQRVADILAEDPVAEQWPEIVAEHYTAAGNSNGAFTWWHKAGLRAAEISATRAAVDHLNRALTVRTHYPEAGSDQEEIEILRLLGIQLAALKGNGAPEVVETLQRCLELSRQIGGPPGDFDAHFDTLWALHSCYLVRGEITRALEIGDRLTASADQGGQEERRLRAHRMQGLAKLLGGDIEEAFGHYRLVLELYDVRRHAELRFQHASDQGALAHAHLAWGEAIAGRLGSSSRNAQAALVLSSRLQHPHTSAHVLCILATRAQTLGERQAASALAFAGKTLGERHEFPYWSAWADIVLGWTKGNREEQGIALIESAIGAYRRTGASQALPYALLLLAESALACNQAGRALSASEEGWAIAEQNSLMLYASELMRVRALATLRLGINTSHAMELAARAESLAASQGAATFRARAAEFRAHPAPQAPDTPAMRRKSEAG